MMDNNRQLYKISFGTVCMNRLHHIKLTLPENIEDNLQYTNAEFILLDYNSTDGLEEWVEKEMKQYLDSGILKYYRTTEPNYFNRSHSRNMAFQLTTADIICNVDADNYTGIGFAHYINEEFNNNEQIFLASTYNEEYLEYKDAYGRFASWRKDFFEIGGYDEAMSSYGHEDTDLYDRLARLGRKEINIKNKEFLHSISHNDRERTSNEFFNKSLKHFYISYLPDKTKVIFLFDNNTFESGTLIQNYYTIASPCSIEEGNWNRGSWSLENQDLTLHLSSGQIQKLNSDNGGITFKEEDTNLLFSKVTNKTLLHNTLLSYSIITNSNHIYNNERNNVIKVNTDISIGSGAVTMNFNHTQHLFI